MRLRHINLCFIASLNGIEAPIRSGGNNAAPMDSWPHEQQVTGCLSIDNMKTSGSLDGPNSQIDSDIAKCQWCISSKARYFDWLLNHVDWSWPRVLEVALCLRKIKMHQFLSQLYIGDSCSDIQRPIWYLDSWHILFMKNGCILQFSDLLTELEPPVELTRESSIMPWSKTSTNVSLAIGT